MSDPTLDAYDRAILRALQADSAVTNAELGEMVNLSASQCSRRRAALERSGVILGYGARVDARRIGLGLRAILRVELTGAEGDFDDFLAAEDAVRAAYAVTGPSAYVLDVHVPDLPALNAFVHGRLVPHPRVGQVQTDIVLDVKKETRRLPIR